MNEQANNLTLADVMPHEFCGCEYRDTPAFKLKDMKVIESHGRGGHHDFLRWPGKQQSVVLWVVLENGKAVGWNENVSHGWSFPVLGKTAVDKALGK